MESAATEMEISQSEWSAATYTEINHSEMESAATEMQISQSE